MVDKKLFCNHCDELRDTKVKLTNIEHRIRDEDIIIKVMLPHCCECGNPLADIDVEEFHFDMALNEYRKIKNLLTPSEIKDIRNSFGLSQRAFARALGFAEPTINRYELGAIQDVVHNNIMLLVRNPINMLEIAKQNRNNLTVKELKLIQDKAMELQAKSGEVNDENLYNEIIKRVDVLEKHLIAHIEKINSKIDDFNDKCVGDSCNCRKSGWIFDEYEDTFFGANRINSIFK